MARKIKYTLGQQRSGVSAVEYLADHGGWEVTIDKLKIEEECIHDNIRRFTQANASPSLLQDQVDILGWTANTTQASQILHGEHNLVEGLDPAIARLAPFLTQPPSLVNISTAISQEDYDYAWTRCREYTSTGTSGLHFGHFMASTKDTDIGEIDRWMIKISFTHGLAL